MKAGWYQQFGAAKDVIEIGEMETPEAGHGQVRVRLHASGVNPSDVKSRAGYGKPFTEERIIPHSDGAGVIDQVGTSVHADRLGQRVWVYNGQYGRPLGTAAEYIVLPVSQVIPLPDGVSFAEGACLGIPAMTAHRCLFAEGPVTGQTVLVTGGAGAVGHYAIQLAKWGGAEVITTISSAEKAAHARQAGADHLINYRSEDVTNKIMELTDGAGIDTVVDVDFGGNLPVTQEVIAGNGTISSYATEGNSEPILPVKLFRGKNVNLHFVLVYNMSQQAKADACKDINQAIEDGALTHAIAKKFPLEQLAEAHEAVESGAMIGNVIVEM